MAFQKVPRQNISAIVFEQLKEHILSGEWRPGQKLPSEASLSSQLGVSRVTVRSALSRLASLGMVQTRQGEGTFVRDRSEADALLALLPIMNALKPDIKHFLEFRSVIDPGMSALAALRASEAEIALMREAVTKFEQSALSDTELALACDLEFHLLIAKATGNPILIKTYEIFADIYRAGLAEIVTKYGVDSGLIYHRHILEAIAGRNPEMARTEMLLHLSSTMDILAG